MPPWGLCLLYSWSTLPANTTPPLPPQRTHTNTRKHIQLNIYRLGPYITSWISSVMVVLCHSALFRYLSREELGSHPADKSTPTPHLPYRAVGSPVLRPPACPSPRVVDVETWWVPISRQEYSLLVPKQIWCGLHIRQTVPSKSPLMLRELLKLFYGPHFWDEQEWTNIPSCVVLSSCTWQFSGCASYTEWFRGKVKFLGGDNIGRFEEKKIVQTCV